MADFALVCEGLVKRYGSVTAVAGLDLHVRRGECFGMLGPNGAGKTTTIEVLGLPWRGHAVELRQRLGSQLQETKLPEKLTVEEVVRLFRSFYRRSRSGESVLAEVGLTEKRRSWVSKLSGGQRQRLAVACALVSEPEVLFLDEPTTGLDPQSRRQVWEIVQQFRRGGGTVLLTTHYMEEAQRLCDRVAIIDHGRVIALGGPAEMIASLGAEHVVEFAVENGGAIPDEVYLRLPGVEAVAHDTGRVRLTASRVHVVVPRLMHLLQERGMALHELTTHHATLEDVFLALTGRHLRDG